MFGLKSKRLTTLFFSGLLFFLSFFWVIRSTFFPVPVFAFHGIVNVNNPQVLSSRVAKYDYSIEKLEEFFRFLIKHNYWFLSTQELYDYFIIKSRPIPSNYAQKKPNP